MTPVTRRSVEALIVCLGCGLVAAALPQDANWDLRNYHVYDPFALLHWRYGWDIAPAQLPTFYNPLPLLPWYLLAQAAPPRLVPFVVGTLQGLNLVLLLALARQVLLPPWRWMAWPVALPGLLGAGTLSMLGTSFPDGMLCLFFLAALLALLRWPRTFAGAALAGLLAGLAAGLKQTMAVYALGLAAACLVQGRLLRLLAFGAAGVAGLLAGGGWWMWFLWERFRNPLFPYLNDLFRAEMVPASDRRDTNFLPESLADALLFPFRLALDSRIAGEIDFTDIRLALLYVALPLALLFRRPALWSDAAKARPLLVACAVTYVAWLGLFAIYRYISGVELLVPLALLLCIDRLPWPRWRPLMAVAALLALLVVYRPGFWERVPWRGAATYLDVQAPVLEEPGRSMVLMAGWQPTAFVIPSFPLAVRFVRIQGNFTSPEDAGNQFNSVMRALVAAHDGPLFLLTKDHELDDAARALETYALVLPRAGCAPLPTALDSRIVFCALRRAGQASSTPSGASQMMRP
jgi:hypothetical protein